MFNGLPTEVVETIVEHSNNRSAQALSLSHSYLHDVIDHATTAHQLNLKPLDSCWQCKRHSITKLPFRCVVCTHDSRTITIPLCSRKCRRDSIDNLPPCFCVTYYDTILHSIL